MTNGKTKLSTWDVKASTKEVVIAAKRNVGHGNLAASNKPVVKYIIQKISVE